MSTWEPAKLARHLIRIVARLLVCNYCRNPGRYKCAKCQAAIYCNRCFKKSKKAAYCKWCSKQIPEIEQDPRLQTVNPLMVWMTAHRILDHYNLYVEKEFKQLLDAFITIELTAHLPEDNISSYI